MKNLLTCVVVVGMMAVSAGVIADTYNVNIGPQGGSGYNGPAFPDDDRFRPNGTVEYHNDTNNTGVRAEFTQGGIVNHNKLYRENPVSTLCQDGRYVFTFYNAVEERAFVVWGSWEMMNIVSVGYPNFDECRYAVKNYKTYYRYHGK